MNDLRPPGRRPVVVVASLVVVAIIGAVLVGCQAQPSAEPSLEGRPSPTVVASPSPPDGSGAPASGPSSEPTPSADASTPGGGLARDSIGVVVTNDLRVRSRPEVSDDSKLLTPLLDSGQLVYVVDGPVAGSGYDWYQVQPLPHRDGVLPFGWVAAAGKDGEQWLAGGRFDCPAPPTTFEAFVDTDPLIGLACFGDRPLEFDARIAEPEAVCGADPGWGIEPTWLDFVCPFPPFLVHPAGAEADPYFDAVIRPDVDISRLQPGVEPGEWLPVRIVGHRDDSAARDCRGVRHDPGTDVPASPEEIVLGCRAQFVITDIGAS